MPNLKPIRRSQLINSSGVGSLVDFRGDESLMVAGLDEWPFAKVVCPPDWFVREERLQARLNVTHFRLPPDYREPGKGVENPNEHIPFVRFPTWHYCPRQGGVAEQLNLFSSRRRCPCHPDHQCHAIPNTKRPFLIPSRFIAVCPKGHIEDFPFMKWIHRDGNWDDTHKLQILPGSSSSSLSGIRARCSCGKSETMAGTFNYDIRTGGPLHKIGYDCSGGTPWFGIEGNPNQCGEHLRVVQRGASNVYFPLSVSSIYLPLWGKNTNSTIDKILSDPIIWDQLVSDLDDGKFIQARSCAIVAAIKRVDSEELREAAQRKFDGVANSTDSTLNSDEEFRRQEYEAFGTESGSKTRDLIVQVHKSECYEPSLAEFLDKICLVRKLRETRVLEGFSRLLPIENSVSPNKCQIAKNTNLTWLPATVVHGEGVFFEFNAQKLLAWTKNPKVKERTLKLEANYNKKRLERGLNKMDISPKYVLLHTFAHALISQLSFDCGYGSAALRERIYCESDNPDQAMQGVLIYTASGDSEGTLGGLVRQGEDPKNMKAIIDRAITRTQWCSSDPVCIESIGQGTDNANFAACHGCVLLPETSCESGNRLLDRGLIVGTVRAPDIGYFSHLYEEKR